LENVINYNDYDHYDRVGSMWNVIFRLKITTKKLYVNRHFPPYIVGVM